MYCGALQSGPIFGRVSCVLMTPDPGPDSADGCVRAQPWTVYPASLAQRRLWFLNELRAPTAAYNVNIGLWFYGSLDLTALRASFQAIVDRHETFRTTFALQGGELIQLVSAEVEVSLPLTDLSGIEDPYPPAYEFAKREVAEPFDLSTGPLFRGKLLRIAPEEHVLLCTMHHTITDAWSMQVFTRELATLYEAITTGNEANLPELSIQYGDFAEWQRKLLGAEFTQNQLQYWRQNLDGAPSLLGLPTDSPRPEEQSLTGFSHTFAVPREIISAVLVLAAEQKATPFMLLLAGFKVLLSRYSGQPDVCVGVPVAGRTQLETEPLIGFFVDTLVSRDYIGGNLSFLELIAKVRETTLGALANADVPFEKVVEMLRPERSLSYNPIFQVMFSVIKSAIRSHDFGNVVAYPYVVDANNSILDLSATFIEDSDGKWWLQIDFDTSLFKIERITRMFEDYMDMLRQLIARPEAKLDEINVQGSYLAQPTAYAPAKELEDRSKNAAQAVTSDSVHVSEREVLSEIWKDVLGLQRVGIYDNFFDIGGHSLLAAHLVTHIHRATGRRIPVSAIFRAPTIADLAALLHEESLNRPDPVLLQLSRGDKTIPFFAVAEPGVDSLGFALLARALGHSHSVFKLQGPGDPTWERPLEQPEIQDLAQQYLSAMLKVQPSGPYCVGAMCNGVLIAQEMIQQLESQGKTVSLFVVLDTWVRENSQVRILWLINYYKDRLRMLRTLSARARWDTAARVVSKFKREDGKVRTRWAEAYWPEGDFRAPCFNAPVLLFKRPQQPFYYVRDPEMGWGRRSTAGVEVCTVDCRHYEFLRQPYVNVVAKRIAARLEQANQDAEAMMSSRSMLSIPNGGHLSTSDKQSVA